MVLLQPIFPITQGQTAYYRWQEMDHGCLTWLSVTHSQGDEYFKMSQLIPPVLLSSMERAKGDMFSIPGYMEFNKEATSSLESVSSGKNGMGGNPEALPSALHYLDLCRVTWVFKDQSGQAPITWLLPCITYIFSLRHSAFQCFIIPPLVLKCRTEWCTDVWINL